LSAKRVVPTAPDALHVDQCVAVSEALPSAHVITKDVGRTTVVSMHVRTLTAVEAFDAATALMGEAKREPVIAARSARAARGYERRDMRTAFW
jgi:hypothetical protein